MLNSYISTRNSNFNRHALNLYLENLGSQAFPQPEVPLRIFKTIDEKMTEHGSTFFSFVEEFENYINGQSLTPSQKQFLYRIVNDYLKDLNSKSFNYGFRDYYPAYHSYFKTLSQVICNTNTQAALATTEIPALLNEIVHRHMLILSNDIEAIPVGQKARVITALYKAMAATSKTNATDTTNDNHQQSSTPTITIPSLPESIHAIPEACPEDSSKSLTRFTVGAVPACLPC